MAARNRAAYEEAIRLYIETTGDQEVERLYQSLSRLADGSDGAAEKAGDLVTELQKLAATSNNIRNFTRLKSEITESGQAIEAAKKRLAELRSEFDLAERPTKKLERALQQAERQVDSLTKTQNRQSAELQRTSNALTKAGVDTTKLNQAYAQLQGQFGQFANNASRTAAAMDATAQGSRRAAAGVGGLDKAAKSTSLSIAALAARLTTVSGAALTAVKALAAASGAALFTGAIRSAATLEEALSEVRAVSGATAEEMVALKEAAEAGAATTKFTSLEAAQGLGELARATGSARSAIESLPAALNLAQAAGIGVADAAQFITTTLTQFGLSASEAGRAADVLAKAANDTQADVQGLGNGLSYVAPLAKLLNNDLESTVAVLAALAKQGYQGERAGTALRNVFSELLQPSSAFAKSLRDIGIESTDFETIIIGLAQAGDRGRDALLNLDDAARPAIASLVANAGRDISQLRESLGSVAGEAERVAKVMGNNLPGAAEAIADTFDRTRRSLVEPLLEPLRDELFLLAQDLEAFAQSPEFEEIKGALKELFIDTPNADVLKDAIGVIVKNPSDSHVHMSMFGLGSYSDVRSDARGRIESYITKGVESRYTLMGDHYIGQMALMLYCLPDAPTPEVNDNLCLSTNAVGYTANEQYVRIKGILSRESQSFVDSDNVTFQRDVIIVETVTALLFQFYGQSPTRYSSIKPPTRVHETNVIEAQTYATVKPIEAAESGDLKVQVDSPFVPIVPSTLAETPVVDQLAGNGTVSYVQAGPTDGLATAFTSAFTAGVGVRRFLGNPFARGSVRVTAGAVELTDDGSGNLVVAGGSPWGGTVDYEAGSVEVIHSSGAGSTNVAIVATAAAPIVMQGYSDFIGITPGNQGFTYVLQLNPIPAPGTVVVDFRALGRWIRLTDTGTGQLTGRPGQGSGNINYATGSVVITCGALPDLGSQILASWGTGVVTERRDTDVAITPPALHWFLPDQGIKPGSVTISWLAGGSPASATDDGAGVLLVGGNPAGSINYSAGEVTLRLATLPDVSSLIHTAYDWAEQTEASFTPVPDGGGIVSFNLGATGLRPGGVRLDWLTSVRPANVVDVGAPVISLRIEARDDGAGLLVAVSAGGIRLTGNLGTINYATGAVSLQVGQISIPNVPFPNYEEGYNNQYWRISGKTRAAGLAVFSAGTQLNGAWQLAAAADNAGDDEIPLPPVEVDLTPGIIDAVVPGGVRFTFRGRTYVDRAGSLYFNVDPVSGAGIYAGSIDYASGKATISNWAAGGSNAISIQALLTRMFEPGTDAIYFRTPGAPLRAGAFTLRATTLEGDLITAAADISGNLVAAGIDGAVQWEPGIVRVRFGAMVPAAGNEGEPWYNPNNVVGTDVWKPHLVIPSSVFFGAVVYRSIPLSSVVVGLDPTRLPADGRVPGFKAGQTLLVHHGKETTLTPTPGQVVNLGRTGLSEVEVRDAEFAPVISDWYTLDLDAGTVTFSDPLNLSAYTMPLTIRDTIENRRLCAGVQITGEIELNTALSRDFPAGSLVSSALRLGEANGSLDLQARVVSLFDIATWNASIWLDQLGPGQSSAPATFNETDYPLIVTNADAITERWAIVFQNATTFRVVGETVGEILTGQSTTVDCAPVNPRTGQPYFRIPKEGFGSGWATNNAIRFNTVGGLAPIWFARCTLAGTPETEVDSFRFKTIGNSAGVTP